MPVTIDSTRFGTLEISDEAVVDFPNGLIGLGGTRYTLLVREESAPFLWLHSIDDPSLALPVTNPGLFFPDYEPEIDDETVARLDLGSADDALLLVIVTVAKPIEASTANLLGPIVVNRHTRAAAQAVLSNSGYATREALVRP